MADSARHHPQKCVSPTKTHGFPDRKITSPNGIGLSDFNIYDNMTVLTVGFLSEEGIPETLELDRLCFGGLWNEAGYRREIESPNSDLVVLRCPSAIAPEVGSEIAPDGSRRFRQRTSESTLEPAPQSTPETAPESSPETAQLETAQMSGKDQDGTEQQQEDDQLQRMLGISCSWAIVDEAHITLLGIHPDFRRQGFGMLMLWVQLHLACQRGMKRATLEVRSSNKGAIALYHSFGFKQAGIRKGYYQDTREDALILWRGGLQAVPFQTELKEWKEQVDQRLRQFGWILNLTTVSPFSEKDFHI
ncbi:MAG: GNAT family N-acetyltransferase [Leptolyngbyaceae bacterium]|nr:GNAT family N-acetyltransferase [Leptolyngbyaceae bacterium]